MFKQLEPLLTETDWEKFDGYSPTFTLPANAEHDVARRRARVVSRDSADAVCAVE